MPKLEQKSFTAKIQEEGGFIFVSIPFSPKEVWQVKPPYHVVGTINDVDVKGTLGSLQQDYFLRLSKVWLQKSGIKPGENVVVKLSINNDKK